MAQSEPPLCPNHYAQWRKNGVLNPLRQATIGCKVDGCERKHCAKGYCARHYEQVLLFGTTYEIGARRGVSRKAVCREPGCHAHTYFPYCPEHTPADRVCTALRCERPTQAISMIFCKTHAQADRSLRHSYNISLRQKEALIAERDHRCDICGREADLHLDHDHQTQAIRGFLCGSCNRALGLFGDDAARVLAAAQYLEVHRV